MNFSIGVVADGCKTGTGDTTCDVVAGDTFTVSAYVDSYFTTTGAYTAIQVQLDESAGLTYQDRGGGVPEVFGVWPDCASGFFAEDETSLPGSYRAACEIGFAALASTATGVVVEVDYTCPTAGSETVTLVHGTSSNTILVDESSNDAIDPDSDEVLTINCVGAAVGGSVGGIVETLTGSDSPAEGSASSSSDNTLAIAAAAAGAVLALAAGGWYARRRWLS